MHNRTRRCRWRSILRHRRYARASCLERFRPDCTRRGRGDLLAEQGVVTRHGGAMARRRNAVPQAKRPASAVQSGRKRSSFLTNATNPKGIIFMVAVLPQFIAHDAPLLPQLLILAATMCTIDL